MSIFIIKNGKKVLPASFFIKLLVFCCLIGVSAVLLQPLQAALNNVMQRIHTELIKNLENITGLRVYYSSIRPAFWGSFDIRNLRFMNNDAAVFSVSRVRFNFSIKELIFRRKLFIHTVQIEKPLFDIDTLRDKNTLDTLASLFNNAESDADSFKRIADFLPQDAVYEIRGGSFSLTDNEFTCRLDDIYLNLLREARVSDASSADAGFLSISEEARDFLFDGRFSVLFRYARIFDRAIIVSAGIDIKGVLAANFEEGSAGIGFSSVYISQQEEVSANTGLVNPALNADKGELLLTVLSFNTILAFKDSVLSLSNPYNAGALGVSSGSGYFAGLNTRTGGAYVEINLDGFRITDQLTFTDEWSGIKQALDLQLTGGASLQYANLSSGENPVLDYHADLRGRRQPGRIMSAFGGPLLDDAFVLNASGNEESVLIHEFIFSSSALTTETSLFYGAAGFSGSIEFSPLLLNGRAVFDRFSLSGDEYLDAAFEITSNTGEIKISSGEIKIAQTSITDMEISLYPSEKEIDVSVSCLIGQDGDMYLDAVFYRNPGQIEGSLSLLTVSLYDMTETIRPFINFVDFPSIASGYLLETEISAEIFLSTDFNNIVYNVPNLSFDYGEINGSISLSGTDRQFTLSEGIISLYENELYASAVMNFSNPADMDFYISADYLDFSWRLDGSIMDRNTLILNDPNGLNVFGNILDSGAVSAYVESVNFPIPVNTQTVYLSFFSVMRYESREIWNLDIDNFSAGFNGEDYLMFSGSVNQDGADFRYIEYSDAAGVLSGNAGAAWDIDTSYIKVNAGMSDNQGESYILECSYNDGRFDASLSVSQIQVNRFFKGSESMRASGAVTATWDSINSFSADIKISSFNAFLQNSPISGSIDIEFNNNELFAHNLNLEYAGLRAFMPQLRLDRSLGIIKTSADVRVTSRSNIAANILLDVNFKKVDSWLEIMKALEEFDGTLMFRNIRFHELRNDEMAFVFSGKDGAFSVTGGIRDMLRLEIDSQGQFFAGFSSPFPIQGTVIGTFIDGNLDASCGNIYMDMESFWSLVGNEIEGFSIAGGYLTGQMDFRGPLTNPEFYGRARGTSLCFQVPGYVNADMRPVPFEIIAEGYDMTFNSVIVPIGSGSGLLDGWFHFENWIPYGIGLDIQVPAESPIPFDIGIAGFLAEGHASGKLDILLDLFNANLEISGDLYTNDAELGLNFGEITSNQERMNNPLDDDRPRLNTMINFKITTGTKVEFAWPASSPIIRGNPELGSVINITSDTRSRQYSLNGDINIRSGELNYFDRSFYIRQGKMIFREDENKFDPRITARAEIRDHADIGSVTISMIVDNQPLRNFEPRFESSPSLTQLEIYSILGQNLSNNPGGENLEIPRFLLSSTTDILTQIIATSDTLSQFVFFRQIERSIRNFLRLDMFSIRTRLLQNAVMSGVSGFTQAPVDRNFSVGNYFDNTAVFIGKYIGRDMFIQGMLTMRYDEYSVELGGLVFEPDIGIELQSPYVNIKWSFFPYHPENWWVSDNSITLSWRMIF